MLFYEGGNTKIEVVIRRPVIKGRNIHNNFLYVWNLAIEFRKTKSLALLMKLYISKAFD